MPHYNVGATDPKMAGGSYEPRNEHRKRVKSLKK